MSLVARRMFCCATMLRAGASLLLLIGLSPVSAQESLLAPNLEGSPTSRVLAARAAGMRAINTCTQLFTAGLGEAQLQRDVLGPGHVPLFQTVVDQVAKTVAVKYLEDMPPRLAMWRPSLGCTQLPVGATPEEAVSIVKPIETATAPDNAQVPWPMGDKAALSKFRMREERSLAAVLDSAFKGGQYGGVTWGVVVVQGGKIRAERYREGYNIYTPQRTNSMCKSLAGSLVGLAVRQNRVNLQAHPVLKEWSGTGDPRGHITLEALLHMSSGLLTESGGNPQNYMYYGGAAAAERAALNVVDSTPNSRFQYAGADTILAVRAVREAYGDEEHWPMYPYRELLWKIGMTHTTVELDWNGDFLMSGDCWSTARDFARLGTLYLNNGAWNGEQLLPEAWSKYVATPSPTNPIYGGQFWLLGGRSGLPDDTFAAFGAQGQYALIVPSKKLVVVRRGFDQSGDDFAEARFTVDVINALRL